jgi:GGDEF domain-containing protein
LARFDALTGLPNRVTLRDRIEQVLSEWRSDNSLSFCRRRSSLSTRRRLSPRAY